MRRWLVTLLLAALPLTAFAARPPAIVPASTETIIEILPRGYAALAPNPGKHPASLAQVATLLTAAARTGDARLATRADALLAQFPAGDSSPELLRARAFSAQHRHDFPAALKLLDALVASQPRDGDARLSRAQIHLVQGRLDLARADCAALAFGVDAGRGLLCVTALSLRDGKLSTAAAMSDRWLAQAPPADPSRRFVMLTRAEISARSGAVDADAWFRRALAPAPDDVRILAAYSRFLRSVGRNADSLHLLAPAANTDGLQLERALAAKATNATNAAALARSQARRYQLAHDLGSQPELRDEAEFELTLRGDANAALALAQKNFTQQRDFEDVNLLIRSANAAGNPQALDELRRWAQTQHLSLPAAAGATR